MSPNKISFEDLPHQQHADLLDDLETMADLAYTHVVDKLLAELTKLLKKEKLVKSEDDRKRGWTGEVPKIELDFEALMESAIARHMNALKYILLGDLAGKEAKADAKSLDLPRKVIPGIMQSAYLDAIDTQREHKAQFTGQNAPTIPKDLIKESMLQIQKRTERFAEESLQKLSNRITSAVELEAQRVNDANMAGGAATTVPKREVRAAIKEATENHRTDWKRLVNADVQVASAVGTHQAVQEIFGRDDDEVRVAWVAMRDEKTCSFCQNASRNPDGSFKLYKMSDFEPAGYNYGKKRDQWRLCIPPSHPNCRCTLVYIPRGFTIDKSGALVLVKK